MKDLKKDVTAVAAHDTFATIRRNTLKEVGTLAARVFSPKTFSSVYSLQTHDFVLYIILL